MCVDVNLLRLVEIPTGYVRVGSQCQPLGRIGYSRPRLVVPGVPPPGGAEAPDGDIHTHFCRDDSDPEKNDSESEDSQDTNDTEIRDSQIRDQDA